jgi:hypothetical protein
MARDEHLEIRSGSVTHIPMAFTLRKATLGDIPVLEGLITTSARELSRDDYSEGADRGRHRHGLGCRYRITIEFVPMKKDLI